MPKFLQGMLVPTLMLWLYAIAFGVIHGALPEGTQMSPRARTAADFALSLILAWWVIADARKRGKRLCYDYDAFIFFFWPVVLPVYLFQTRRARAFLTVLCFAGICAVAGIVAGVIAIVVQ